MGTKASRGKGGSTPYYYKGRSPFRRVGVSSVEESVARTAGEEVATGASVASVEAAIYPEPEEEEEAGEETIVVAGTRGDP